MRAVSALTIRKQIAPQLTTIGAMCDQFGGEVQTGPFGSQLHASDYSEYGIPVVMPQDLVDGGISPKNIATVDESHAIRLSQHKLRSGDVVFSRRGDVSRFAVVTAPEEGWLCGTGCIRIRLNCSEIDTGYLRHFLRQDQVGAWLLHHAKGVTMPNLNTEIIRSIPFSYPPLDKQRRIAAILDKADALRRKRKRAIELVDGLCESLFLELFGDPATNPKRLKLGRIGDLLDGVQYGTSAKAGGIGRYPILRMGNITIDGKMDFDDLKYIDLTENEVEKFTVKKGDILFNRTNSAELVGKTGVFDRDEPFAYAGYLVRARTKDGVSPEYISGYLNSAHGKATLRGMAKSIIGMANINAKELQSIPILIPDGPSQRKYAELLSVISRRRMQYTDNFKYLDDLFSSVQSRAFSGQL